MFYLTSCGFLALITARCSVTVLPTPVSAPSTSPAPGGARHTGRSRKVRLERNMGGRGSLGWKVPDTWTGSQKPS